jgi:hypothetical protein
MALSSRVIGNQLESDALRFSVLCVFAVKENPVMDRRSRLEGTTHEQDGFFLRFHHQRL